MGNELRAPITPDDLTSVADLVFYLKNRVHRDGAYLGLPEAVHKHECPSWRIGKRHGPCNCGGDEIQAEVNKILGIV